VLDNLVANGGNLGKAIRDTGLYSEVVANDPGKITDSKTWQELVEQYLPDDILAEKHRELLSQVRIEYFMFPKGLDDEEIRGHLEANGLTCLNVRMSDKGKMAFYAIPDSQARSKAIEMGYKLKGRTMEDGAQQKSGNTYNILFAAETQATVKAFEESLKDKLLGYAGEDSKGMETK